MPVLLRNNRAAFNPSCPPLSRIRLRLAYDAAGNATGNFIDTFMREKLGGSRTLLKMCGRVIRATAKSLPRAASSV